MLEEFAWLTEVTGCRWSFWSRGLTWSELCFRKVTTAAVWRMDPKGESLFEIRALTVEVIGAKKGTDARHIVGGRINRTWQLTKYVGWIRIKSQGWLCVNLGAWKDTGAHYINTSSEGEFGTQGERRKELCFRCVTFEIPMRFPLEMSLAQCIAHSRYLNLRPCSPDSLLVSIV